MTAEIDLEFSIAKFGDSKEIMCFIHRHWKANHILCLDEALFLYEYRNNDLLNIAIVKDAKGYLLGIWAFYLYSKNEFPDIAGSIWRITDDAQKKYPLLGFKLRDYGLRHVNHRFYLTPGAGIQTKKTHQILRMDWHVMEQWYWLNPQIISYEIASVASKRCAKINKQINVIGELILVSDVNLLNFTLLNSFVVAPFKDKNYVIKRFFRNPIFNYDVYHFWINDNAENIVVCRRIKILNSSVYRIVDFYGDEKNLSYILIQLQKIAIKENDEYLDFCCYGFNNESFKQADFQQLKIDQEQFIIPHYFQPLVRKNVAIYCVSNAKDFYVRFCKADGDQDRPN